MQPPDTSLTLSRPFLSKRAVYGHRANRPPLHAHQERIPLMQLQYHSNHHYLGNWTLLPPDSQETTARATATNGKRGSPPSDPPLPAQSISQDSLWFQLDDQQPAGCVAVTYIDNRESQPHSRTLGFMATGCDADLCALTYCTIVSRRPSSP